MPDLADIKLAELMIGAPRAGMHPALLEESEPRSHQARPCQLLPIDHLGVIVGLEVDQDPLKEIEQRVDQIINAVRAVDGGGAERVSRPKEPAAGIRDPRPLEQLGIHPLQLGVFGFA